MAQQARYAEIDDMTKGLPFGARLAPAEAAPRHWNLLDDDLPFPLLLLKDSALEHNITAMARWCAQTGFLLAPHGKTTMCPQMYRRQLQAGAWGITVANVCQAQVCTRSGVRRVFIANQVVGRANIRSLAEMMRAFPSLECWCLADSVAGVRHLAAALEEFSALRPLQVLLECGRRGWRTGVQSVEQARAVHAEILKHPRSLAFRGLEGFEGSAKSPDGPDAEAAEARAFVEFIAEVGKCLPPRPGDGQPPVFSIGGSSFLDVVWEALERLEGAWQPVVRAGCYVTHDHGHYAAYQREATRRRRQQERAPLPEFQPALELWSAVQSLPEENVAILNFGKRDCSYDVGLPVPLFAVGERGGLDSRRALDGAAITRLNDQHAFLSLPAGLALSVADRVCCGISHPCTAFDKWRVIPLVDDSYQVLDLYATFF
jgi:D-serine dehydratase